MPDTESITTATGPASADLLALGKHHGRLAIKNSTDSSLGSVTRAVLEHAHSPIAIVPESEEEQ
jgi:nucleotide-binding universal stress UspA family protein